MASWSQAAHAPATAPRPRSRPRPQPHPRPARRAVRRTPVAGGVLWIALLAGLLGGVVALNVAVLQLNVELDRLGREKVELRADNARLSSQLSSVAATPQIAARAHERLGLVPASPEQTTYVELVPER